MPLFTKTPPKRLAANCLPIVRAPARGNVRGLSLAEHLTGTWLHFYGRSTPCTRTPDCPICARTNEPRWTGYLPVWNPKTGDTYLVEMPTAAAEQVEKHLRNNGTIKHKSVLLTRPKGKANSPVHVAIEHYETKTLNIPPCPNVELALCAIWQLDPNKIEESLNERMSEIERYHAQQEEGNGKPNSHPV